MAVTPTGAFAQAPNTGYAVATAANTTLTDSPDDTQLLFTAGANGSIVSAITAIQRATNAATVLYLYLSKDGGTTKRMVKSIAAAATTVSTTASATATDFGYSDTAPLYLKSTDSLYAGASVALTDGWAFTAIGSDL